MRTLKLVILFLFTSLAAFAGGIGQFGVSLKGSTNGLGADVYYRPLKRFAVKVGYEAYNINASSANIQSLIGSTANISVPMPTGTNMGFDLGADLKSGSFLCQVGFQPIGLFYVTAGLGTFLFNVDATATPTTDFELGTQTIPGYGTVSPIIPKNKLGDFTINVKPTNKIAPYFGVGLGRFVPHRGRISFALELGTFVMGAPKLSYNLPSGLTAANVDYGVALTSAEISSIDTQVNSAISDLKAQLDTKIADINSQLTPYRFYPVLKLTIGIKLL